MASPNLWCWRWCALDKKNLYVKYIMDGKELYRDKATCIQDAIMTLKDETRYKMILYLCDEYEPHTYWIRISKEEYEPIYKRIKEMYKTLEKAEKVEKAT